MKKMEVTIVRELAIQSNTMAALSPFLSFLSKEKISKYELINQQIMILRMYYRR